MNCRHRFGLWFGICLLAAAAQPARTAPAAEKSSRLEAGFQSPPPDARPLAWWHWINGNVTKAGIRADLEDMKRVGIGGAQMLDVSIYLPPGPVRYGSDLWHEHVQYAIRTAGELGLELDLMNCPGWSASGGPWVIPEQSMKQFVWSELDLEGGRQVDEVLPQPRTNLGFYRDVAVLAVPCGARQEKTVRTNLLEVPLKGITPVSLNTSTFISPGQVLNLTADTAPGGRVRAQLPSGRWTILRFGFTSTGSQNHPAVPEGHGLEIDKMDGQAVAFQFDKALGRIIRDAGPLAGKALRGILFDSFEGGFQNWTANFPQEFQRLKQYDLVPYLPALTGRAVGSAAESEAVLRDFRSVVNELIARNYFGTMQRSAHEHGLKVYAEAQGGPLNPILCNEYVDVPMNEFWVPDAAPRVPKIGEVTSIAHLLGRPIIAAESFTAKPEDGRWQNTPATLKLPGDCAFTAGINRFIFHTYVHQPYDLAPGFTLGRYGTHFGRLNTWWPLADAWMAYIARCQFLLQQGRPYVDICLLIEEDAGYTIPDRELQGPAGYGADVCYGRHLGKMVWKDGALRLPSGVGYRVLALPKTWTASLSDLKELDRLIGAGALVVGAPPSAPTGLHDLREGKAEWEALVRKLWGPEQAPRVQPRQHLAEALPELGIERDFDWSPDSGEWDIRFIHRVTSEGDIYFLANHSRSPATFQASFRMANRAPELWDAVSGQRLSATAYTVTKSRITLPLALEASGSVFVVFRKPLPENWVTSVTSASTETLPNRLPPAERAPGSFLAVDPGTYSVQYAKTPERKLLVENLPPALPIDGPWHVRFQPGRGAPKDIELGQLISWSNHPEPGVRYFSGIATYTTSFTLPPNARPDGQRYLLQLGQVCDLAGVKLNGREVGIVWTAPFELDVTQQLLPGTNRLEVCVANRWINRLIGDETLPPDAEYATTEVSKFTQGRLKELPSWLHDPQALRQRQRVAFTTWHHYGKEAPLVESGLLGPVRLRAAQALQLPVPPVVH
jgi:hypothetical protein